jgi:hypothetical protein
MYEENHEQTRANLQAQVNGFAQHARWLVHGSGEVIGLEKLRPRDVIEIINCGKASGEYYVTDVEHILRSGEFFTAFKVARTWEGQGEGGSRVQQQAVALESAGEVVLA